MPQSLESYIADFTPEQKDLFKRIDKIARDNGLEYSVKWGIPTYTYQGKNYIGVAQFKNHTGIWFHYGSLLEDSKGLLEQSQEKTKHLRTWKLTDPSDFDESVFRDFP